MFSLAKYLWIILWIVKTHKYFNKHKTIYFKWFYFEYFCLKILSLSLNWFYYWMLSCVPFFFFRGNDEGGAALPVSTEPKSNDRTAPARNVAAGFTKWCHPLLPRFLWFDLLNHLGIHEKNLFIRNVTMICMCVLANEAPQRIIDSYWYSDSDSNFDWVVPTKPS